MFIICAPLFPNIHLKNPEARPVWSPRTACQESRHATQSEILNDCHKCENDVGNPAGERVAEDMRPRCESFDEKDAMEAQDNTFGQFASADRLLYPDRASMIASKCAGQTHIESGMTSAAGPPRKLYPDGGSMIKIKPDEQISKPNVVRPSQKLRTWKFDSLHDIDYEVAYKEPYEGSEGLQPPDKVARAPSSGFCVNGPRISATKLTPVEECGGLEPTGPCSCHVDLRAKTHHRHEGIPSNSEARLPSPVKIVKLRRKKRQGWKLFGKNKNQQQFVNKTSSKPRPSVTFETFFLVFLSVTYGVIGVMPTFSLGDHLPCGDCGTEMCFVETASSFWCTLNRSSTFVLQCILNCIASKAAFLQLTIANNLSRRRQDRFRKYAGMASIAVPIALCVTGFLLENLDPRHIQFNLHLARSSVFCRMRFDSYLQEFLLLQFPMMLSLLIIVFSLAKVLYHVHSAYIRMKDSALLNSSSISAKLTFARDALRRKPQVFFLFKLAGTIFFQFLLLLIVTSMTAPVLAEFQADSESWLKCIR